MTEDDLVLVVVYSLPLLLGAIWIGIGVVRRRAFPLALNRLQLEVKGPALGRGRRRGFDLEIERGQDSSKRVIFRVLGLPLDLSLASRPDAAAHHHYVALETGEEPFDLDFEARGPSLEALALLGAEPRQRLVGARSLFWTLRLEGGALEAQGPPTSLDELHLEALLDAAEALVAATGLDAVAALGARVFEEEAPRAQWRALLALVGMAERPGRREALRRALSHSEAELRLIAARALGDEAWEVMAALARGGHPSHRARALSSLPEATPQAELYALALRGLEDARADAQVLSAAARLAARVPLDVPLEQALLACADVGRPDPARHAAIKTLEAVGTVRAVEPLLTMSGRWLRIATRTDAPIRDAARAAVRAIQARTEGEAGAFALAPVEGEAGVLSLAGGEGGELTLTGERE